MNVDLWCWRLDDGDVDALIGYLSPDERERAERYQFPQHRRQFIAARGRVRLLLGTRVGAAPESLAFDLGEHGKPSLRGQPGLHFNFSDSGDLGALAITHAGPVGVDIERVRRQDYLGMVKRYFSAAEQDVLRALPDEQHQMAFFRGWTRKEAFLKAVGSGLSTRLDAFDVTIGDEPARVLRIDPAIDAEVGAWSLQAFDPAPGYLGAIAVRGGGGALVVTHHS